MAVDNKEDNIGVYRTFLENVELLNKHTPKNLDSSFNIFSILRKEYEEVAVHSRFIFELLNPEGSHNRDVLFLKGFLKIVKIENFDINNVKVKREAENIDILITNNLKEAVIIENKINSGDKEEQLERYYKKVLDSGFKKEAVYIVYLTLDGKPPSRQSSASVPEENIICKSYKDDIISWLDICIKETALFPMLRETILMYQNLVKKLTGQSLERRIIMEIREMILENRNNFKYAVDLEEALKEAKTDIQCKSWSKLKEVLKNRDNIITENNEYAISIHINVPENEEVIFKVEIYNGRIFYGISDIISNNKILENIKSEKSKINWQNECPGWKYWKYLEEDINFKKFDNEATLALVEEESREDKINDIAEEIDGIIKRIQGIN